jgi:hypothetical protein
MSLKKKKLNLQAPSFLLWKMPFEFETPLTFEQCIGKLELLKSLEGSFPIEHVELISRSENRCQFKVEDRRGWLGRGWTLGDVRSVENSALRHVSGKIGITPGVGFFAPFVISFFACPIICAFQLVNGGAVFVLIPVVTILIYSIFFYLALNLRQHLYADLKHLFRDAPPPENPFAEFLDESESAEDQSPSAGRRAKDAGG